MSGNESCFQSCFEDISMICCHPYVAFSYELNTGKGYYGNSRNCLIDYCACRREFNCCCCFCICCSNILKCMRDTSNPNNPCFNCFTIIPPCISGFIAIFVCVNSLIFYPCTGRQRLNKFVKLQSDFYHEQKTNHHNTQPIPTIPEIIPTAPVSTAPVSTTAAVNAIPVARIIIS